MPVNHTRVFISHSTKNSSSSTKLVERLRDHYNATWYSPRQMPGGYFAKHPARTREVQAAIATNDVVVVGMAQNPFPKKACRALDAQRIAYKYLEYGSYLNNWRRRNALKMWTGWPHVPDGFSSGGCSWAERATWRG
jgi:monothiol glutaredoxin